MSKIVLFIIKITYELNPEALLGHLSATTKEDYYSGVPLLPASVLHVDI